MDEATLAVMAAEVHALGGRMGRVEETVDELGKEIGKLREDAARADGLRTSQTRAIEELTKAVDGVAAVVKEHAERTATQHTSIEGRLRAIETTQAAARKPWGVADWAGATTVTSTIVGGIVWLVYALLGQGPPTGYHPPVANPIAPAPAPDEGTADDAGVNP